MQNSVVRKLVNSKSYSQTDHLVGPMKMCYKVTEISMLLNVFRTHSLYRYKLAAMENLQLFKGGGNDLRFWS